jgi:hypothetical protein
MWYLFARQFLGCTYWSIRVVGLFLLWYAVFGFLILSPVLRHFLAN